MPSLEEWFSAQTDDYARTMVVTKTVENITVDSLIISLQFEGGLSTEAVARMMTNIIISIQSKLL